MSEYLYEFTKEELENAKKDYENFNKILEVNKTSGMIMSIDGFYKLLKSSENYALDPISDIKESFTIINPDLERVYFACGLVDDIKISEIDYRDLDFAKPYDLFYNNASFFSIIVYDAKNNICYGITRQPEIDYSELNIDYFIFDLDENFKFIPFDVERNIEDMNRFLLSMKVMVRK